MILRLFEGRMFFIYKDKMIFLSERHKNQAFFVSLLHQNKEEQFMTTMELNAELFRQLSIIAEDESLMRKAVKAVTRLAKQKETEETEYIGKEEILKGIDAGLKEMVERKHSGNKAKTLEELINEL